MDCRYELHPRLQTSKNPFQKYNYTEQSAMLRGYADFVTHSESSTESETLIIFNDPSSKIIKEKNKER